MKGSYSRRETIERLGAAGMAALMPANASAQTAADFYAGKTVNIICGYNPGGGVDVGTRLIAKHIARFLPGGANVVVKNMQGASGIVAANYLYVKAAPDGLTLAVPGRDWVPKPALGQANAVYDSLRFAYIGSTGGFNNIAWIRGDLGIRTPADLRNSRKKLIFGGLPQNTVLSSVPKLLQDIGMPVNVIMGYENTARIVLAIEQKELDAIYTAITSLARRRDLIDTKALVPVFQSEPEQPGVALVDELVPEPQRLLLRLIHASATFGMPLIAPPGTPPDRVEFLRKAFFDMARDAAFQAEAVTIGEPASDPVEGAALAGKVSDMLRSLNPATVAAFKSLTGE
jgi:hypothetical protein